MVDSGTCKTLFKIDHMGRYLLVNIDWNLFQFRLNAELIISSTFSEVHEERIADTLDLTPIYLKTSTEKPFHLSSLPFTIFTHHMSQCCVSKLDLK